MGIEQKRKDAIVNGAVAVTLMALIFAPLLLLAWIGGAL